MADSPSATCMFNNFLSLPLNTIPWTSGGGSGLLIVWTKVWTKMVPGFSDRTGFNASQTGSIPTHLRQACEGLYNIDIYEDIILSMLTLVHLSWYT